MSARRLAGPLGELAARVAVPTSKSLTNRALIAAAAAQGGRVLRPLDCEDTRLLARALAAAGWPLSWDDEIAIGSRRPIDEATVRLGNSGTGARLVIGLLACVDGRFVVDGSERLRQRPMQPIVDALAELGCEIRSRDGYLPVEIRGRRLAGGAVRLRPGVSSQFVSSLLLAAPLMTRGLELEVVGEVPSKPYLELTRRVLEVFGVDVERPAEDRWRVAPGGYRSVGYPVEGDWSASAFPAAAAAVAGGTVHVGPLDRRSAQGDRAICAVLERAGVEVGYDGDAVVFGGPVRRALEADLGDTPDLFPALAVVAATRPGGAVLRGLEHLRHKESDRLSVMVDNLSRLGARFDVDGRTLVVTETIRRNGGSPVAVTAAGDHRIAMAMAVAALAAGPLELDDGDCVDKSFPGFWAMWDELTDGARPR